MTDTAVNENGPSVVDDFFTALFANNAGTSSNSDTDVIVTSSSAQNSSASTPTVEEHIAETTEKSNATLSEQIAKTKNTLDEFDEYSLLSSRSQPDDTDSGVQYTTSPSNNFPGESPAQILSKRDIDWSTVTPESRMLIRQLPKDVDKQAIMDYFSKYGEVIEVVQKNAFGFVHFENPAICARAVENENGKYFNGVIFDLEICKRKPFFARALESKARRRDISPPPPRRRSRSPPRRSRSRSPPRRHRRNSLPRNNNIDRRGPRNRQNDNSMNDNNRYDYNRRFDGYNSTNNNSSYRRPEPRFNDTTQQYHNGYNSNHKQALIPLRSGQNIPTVQIVSWSNAYRNFTDHVEGVFASHSIRTSMAVVQFSQANRDEIVKQMVIEGVKALIIVDSLNESKHRVYLQIFRANENGEGVRYDEYDSVTPNEAVSIVKNSSSPIIQYKTQPQYNSPAQYNLQQAQFNSQAYNQQYNTTQPQYNQYARPQQPSLTGIDAYTLNSIYSMLQNNTNVSQTAASALSQPSIPQLIATLMNGLGTSSPLVSLPAQVSMPSQTSLPTTPSAPLSFPSGNVTPKPDQPSIAALLSTASNGNPAIAQLLYQMTAGVTSAPPNPSQPSTQATNQIKSEYTHSR